MTRAGTIAAVTALAIVAAALVGWRGSRPASPIATTRSDGVTVVPATGTLARADVRPAAAATPIPAAAPALAHTDPDAVSMLGDLDRVAAAFDHQPRDPAWSPGTEAGLRTTFAGVPGLSAPVAAECRARLCRIAAHTAANVPRETADVAVATLQAHTSAQTRSAAPFTANYFNLEQNEESGEATFTAYLLRR